MGRKVAGMGNGSSWLNGIWGPIVLPVMELETWGSIGSE